MSTWYGQQSNGAEWIWCSSALRARQTAEYVSRGFNTHVVEEPELYLASAERLLNCLQATPEDVHSVAVVAHNPGLTFLVNLLGNQSVTENLVTFGTALFRTHIPWNQIRFGRAEFISLNTPKSINKQ